MSASLISLREKQRRHTRDEIVRVAFDLFVKRGYDAVPVEAICAEVGISRATFFNYFRQKELILRELAHTRVEKLKQILARFRDGHPPTFADIIAMFREVCEENARMSGRSKRLMLEVFLRQATHGPLLENRAEAIEALTAAIERIPPRKGKDPRLVAETLFAIYMATMLEWMMHEREPQRVLLDNLEKRMRLALEGIA